MTDFNQLVIRVLDELKNVLQSVNSTQDFQQEILGAKRIFLAGKGRSGLQMRAFAMRLVHLGFIVHVVDDVTTPAITEHDLLIIGSGSGRTASLVNYATKAKELQARVAVITIDEHSPIGKMADCVLRLNAPTPKLADSNSAQSIQPMGSLFEQALGLVLDILVVELMEQLHMSAEQMFSRHANLE
jgi:6-phospho-3-hexuloisomerase